MKGREVALFKADLLKDSAILGKNMSEGNHSNPSSQRKLSRRTGRPTLADVAKLASVSTITASRALRGISTVDPELVAKVQEAAAKLGYVVNPAARALASAQSQTVVALIPSLSNQLFIDTLEAIHEVLLPRGLELLIGDYHYSKDEEEKLIRNYLAHQPRGFLLTGFEQSDAARSMLAASRLPIVYMMELADSLEAFSVGFSQQAAGAAVARHLLEKGRKRVAYVAAQLDARVMQRGEGFRRCLQDAGLYDPSLQIMTPTRSSVGLGAEMFNELIAKNPDVDGIFFCNDDLAHGALFEAARRGIRIPDAISMVGFNDLPISAHTTPSLTSIKTHRTEIGQGAAQQLLRLINNEEIENSAIDVGFELMVRESS